VDSATVATPDHNQRRFSLLICLTIAGAVLAIYLQTARFGFVHFDDTGDALNAHIRRGITFENLRWALTSGSDSNWLPLTRLSHIVDFALYGPSAGPRHLENLILHLAASLMVYFFLLRATGDRWPSAFSGLLFAVHPLHVESVAWIAERKDVLSALFWFLTLWAWTGYVQKPSPRRYLGTLSLFVLSLMSKPMAVTLPAVLLLLDFWPFSRGITKRTLIEKIPFALLSAAASVVTLIAQRAGGAVQSFSKVSVAARTANAVTSWLLYPLKTIWPSRLAVWYPFPMHVQIGLTVFCGIILVAVTLGVLAVRRRLPWLSAGWLWYLITTLPVIGLIQVGGQSHADRYMYIPMVGLGMAVVWAATDAARHWPAARVPLFSAGVTALCTLGVCAAIQTSYWRNSESLFGQAIRVTENNFLAMQNLGSALFEAGRKQEAIESFRNAARTKPDAAGPYASLCAVLPDKEEALRNCDVSLRLEAENWEAHNNRGSVLKTLGRLSEAMDEFGVAIRQKPASAEPHANLGMLLFAAGRFPEALREEDRALALDPSLAPAHYTRGRALLETGQPEAAVEELEIAVRMQPTSAEAHGMLGLALSRVPWGVFDCFKEFQTALQLDPNLAVTHANLALALWKAGRHDEALQQIRMAVQLEPGPKWADALKQIEANGAR
jgi:tetratricopeptide (TPR) repeat protein